MTAQNVTQELAAAGASAQDTAKSAWELMQEELIGKGVVQGLEKGREEGLEAARERTAELLVSMLVERFGSVSPTQKSQIGAAPLAQLHEWIRGHASAESIDDLLA